MRVSGTSSDRGLCSLSCEFRADPRLARRVVAEELRGVSVAHNLDSEVDDNYSFDLELTLHAGDQRMRQNRGVQQSRESCAAELMSTRVSNANCDAIYASTEVKSELCAAQNGHAR